MATLSLWDSKSTTCLCTVYRSAACRREVVQFCFCLRTVSQQITSWALLVNRPCMFRHEENLCLFVIHFCYVSTQCFHACWHVSHDHIIHIFHAHSAWLKTSRTCVYKKSVVAALDSGVSLGFQGSLKGESYLTPPNGHGFPFPPVDVGAAGIVWLPLPPCGCGSRLWMWVLYVVYGLPPSPCGCGCCLRRILSSI